MKYNLLFLAILPTFLSAISINEVIQDSIYINPLMDVEKENLKIESERLDEVNSAYLPSIDLSFSIGPEVTKTPSNGAEKASLIRREASATLTQNIFSGFSTQNKNKKQKNIILSAQSSVENITNSLALDTAEAYIDVLKTSALYDIAKDNVLMHSKYLLQIKEKLDAGIAVNSDYVQTLSRYENVKSEEYLAKQNYLISTYVLERLSPDINVTSLKEPIIGKLPATTLDGLLEIAMESNANLKTSNFDVESAKSAIDESNSEYYPTVDLIFRAYSNDSVAGVGYKRTSNPNPISEDKGYNGLLVVNYNLFNGMATSSRKEMAKHILLKKRATQKDTQQFIEANIKVAYTINEMSKKRLTHMQKYINASKKTVTDYLEEYDLGRRTIIDLLNIELEHNNARNLYITTKYDYIKSHYQLLSYTGYLLRDVNIAVK